MKRGEAGWVEFDPAIGSEIRKKPPAVIVSNDAANRNLSRVVLIPMTSHSDNLYPGEAAITLNGERRKALADQIMAADKSRLTGPMGTLSKTDMQNIESAIKLHLGLPR
jgi:mRNA interferase MazF